MSTSAAKLTKNSAAVVVLRDKLESGEILGSEDPKKVWLSHATFQQHNLENFRTFYNNIRKEVDAKKSDTCKLEFF